MATGDSVERSYSHSLRNVELICSIVNTLLRRPTMMMIRRRIGCIYMVALNNLWAVVVATEVRRIAERIELTTLVVLSGNGNCMLKTRCEM